LIDVGNTASVAALADAATECLDGRLQLRGIVEIGKIRIGVATLPGNHHRFSEWSIAHSHVDGIDAAAQAALEESIAAGTSDYCKHLFLNAELDVGDIAAVAALAAGTISPASSDCAAKAKGCCRESIGISGAYGCCVHVHQIAAIATAALGAPASIATEECHDCGQLKLIRLVDERVDGTAVAAAQAVAAPSARQEYIAGKLVAIDFQRAGIDDVAAIATRPGDCGTTITAQVNNRAEFEQRSEVERCMEVHDVSTVSTALDAVSTIAGSEKVADALGIVKVRDTMADNGSSISADQATSAISAGKLA
jgi:hypothetical protein